MHEKKARPWATTHNASPRPSCKQAPPKARHLQSVDDASERHRSLKGMAHRVSEKTSGSASFFKRPTSNSACVKRRELSASYIRER